MPGATIAWTTSSPSVATVSADGTVTAVDGGSALVTATAGGRSASASVSVEHVYDLGARGVPKVVMSDYIELRASRQRSS